MFNPAAGFRRLGARSHSRLLDEQTESLAQVMRSEETVVAIARLLVDLHRELRTAKHHMIAANERASGAEYLPPAAAIEATA